ncbi:hypothetical protein O0235_14185 [Tepidiforma flava]|uniref:Uncharacterized protein n=1 Tax=Tepidiforma flava TaxID=3004094 RepID=A0ABY7M5T8_9CHLR|nr:hypothetical protein [Tepidiforma flava]WBL35900.1 hypothetical protein O0235_14185 [Tepidiforma flava]
MFDRKVFRDDGGSSSPEVTEMPVPQPRKVFADTNAPLLPGSSETHAPATLSNSFPSIRVPIPPPATRTPCSRPVNRFAAAPLPPMTAPLAATTTPVPVRSPSPGPASSFPVTDTAAPLTRTATPQPRNVFPTAPPTAASAPSAMTHAPVNPSNFRPRAAVPGPDRRSPSCGAERLTEPPRMTTPAPAPSTVAPARVSAGSGALPTAITVSDPGGNTAGSKRTVAAAVLPELTAVIAVRSVQFAGCGQVPGASETDVT